jgi:hypothetical protein
MARDPVFLERKSYRQRRLMDAVRLLPLLGLALWMVPLMWSVPQETGEPMPIRAALQYIFGIWTLMVLVCWALWRRTRRVEAPRQDAS